MTRHPFQTRHGRRVRAAILQRDRRRCHYCGQPANTVDHLKPLAEGGSRLDPRNLAAACEHCNKSRGGQLGRQRQLTRYGHVPPAGPRRTWNGAIQLEENP